MYSLGYKSVRHFIYISFQRYFFWLDIVKSIRYTSLPKLRWKVETFIIWFKLIDFFPRKQKIAIITVVSKLKQKFAFGLLKLILNGSYAAPILPSISWVDMTLKICFYYYQYEMMTCRQHQKL